jgi:hypothetical protein
MQCKKRLSTFSPASLSNTMNGYDDATRTLRWDRAKGGTQRRAAALLREHAGTLRQLHVA